jgi:hypothetical protein
MIDKAVNNAFRISQDNCPVDTGYLKSTGRIYKDSSNVYHIRYTAPYASFLERGVKAGIVRIDSYIKSNGKYVRSHLRKQEARKGTFFIKNAILEAFSNLKGK